MGIMDALDNKQGRILISIIWGLGLATLFRRVCVGRNCIIVQAPKLNEVRKNIYGFEGKCYRFDTKSVRCKN
jgi:hypothetical protein